MNQLFYSIPLMFCALKSVHADGVCQQQYGSLNCGAGTVENCQGSGLVHLNGTTVTDTAALNGQVTISSARIHLLDSKGDLRVDQSQIEQIKHKGAVTLKNCQIESIDVHTDRAVIQGGQVQLLVVYVNKTADVYISDGAAVGRIRFVGGSGRVHANGGIDSSQVDNGQIV